VNDWTKQRVATGGSAKAEFIALVASAWKRRWWLVGCVLIFAVVFGVVAFRMPLIYRASTVLVPATPASGLSGALTSALGPLGGIASLAGLDVNTGVGKTDEVMAVLTSRQFIEGFIKEKQLLPILYSGDWDESTGTWKKDREPHTSAQAYKYFKGSILSVEREKGVGLITLHIDWTDGEQAAAWANELVDRLNAEMRMRAMEEANRSVRFLEEETRRTTLVPTQQAIGRLMENQINQRMLANVTSEYALRVVDRAMAPDARDPFKPRKRLIVAAGIVIGLTIGLFLVWFFAEPPIVSRLRDSALGD